jgi:hypothetical protein
VTYATLRREHPSYFSPVWTQCDNFGEMRASDSYVTGLTYLNQLGNFFSTIEAFVEALTQSRSWRLSCGAVLEERTDASTRPSQRIDRFR